MKKIGDEKLHYDINSEEPKCMHYHEAKLINLNMLKVKHLIPSALSQIIEHAKLTYSPIEKALKKQTKAFKD